jgi:hypothetical protein
MILGIKPMVPNVQVGFANVGGEKGWLILLSVRFNAFLLHTEELCNFIPGLVVGIFIVFCLWLLANCVRYVCVCVICGGFLVILSGPVVLLDFGYMGWVLIYRVL